MGKLFSKDRNEFVITFCKRCDGCGTYDYHDREKQITRKNTCHICKGSGKVMYKIPIIN